MARALGQDEAAAVVDDEGQAAGALARAPAEPLCAGLEVETGRAERQEGKPLAVELGDLTQRRADEGGVVQTMLFPEEPLKLRAFGLEEQAHGDAGQHLAFWGESRRSPAGRLPQRRGKNQWYLIFAPADLGALVPDEPAVRV
jgi:hypothetical protein